jgi:Na+-driven multidrug efflux pump
MDVINIKSPNIMKIFGRNAGANNFERAEKTVFRAAKITVSAVFIISLILFLFPEQIFRVFTKDAELIKIGIGFLRILSFSYVFVAVSIITGSAFQGAGHAMPALWITIIRLFFLGIPLALLLAFVFNLGLNGVWLSFSISSVLSGILAFVWFKKGSWKKETLK